MNESFPPSAEESDCKGSSSLFLNLLEEMRQLRERVEMLEKDKERRDAECSAWRMEQAVAAQATVKHGTRIQKLEEDIENCDAQRTAWMEKHCTSAEFVALIDECVSHCTPMVSLKGSVGLLTTMLSSVDREVKALKTDVTTCSRQIVLSKAVNASGAVPPSSVDAQRGKQVLGDEAQQPAQPQVNPHAATSEQKTKGEEKGGILDMIFERVKAISLTCNNQTLNSSNGNNVMTSRAPEQTVNKEGGVTRLVE